MAQEMVQTEHGLVRFRTYTREQVHDIFAPETRFISQTGTWGLHGVVPVPGRPRNWVFFVTFGKRQAHHRFDEHISPEGFLQWQSQPRQTLANPIVQSWIHHNPDSDNIYLFLRTRQSGPYWYLGRLAYVSHDPNKECPVYFTWQILDWNPPTTIRRALGLPGDVPRKTTALTAVVAYRHFLYAQKFSQDALVASNVHGYANSLRGVARLAKYAEGTPLAIRWPDLALVPLTKLLPDELQRTLVILPDADYADQRNDKTELLRSVALDFGASRHPVSKTKIGRAENLALDFRKKLSSVREARHKVSEVLRENFPEFGEVFRNWRTKGALWVLEHHPMPADILAQSSTELADGLGRATRGRISWDKAAQLQSAADRAHVRHSSGSFELFHRQLKAALAEWRSAHNAIESVQRLQDTLRKTGRFPMPRSRDHSVPMRQTRRTMEPLRRTGGRYHTAVRRRKTSEGRQTARIEITCRQHRTGWQVLLMADGAREIQQNGTPLTQEGNLWLLRNLETVLVDGQQFPLSNQVLIFRLSDTATGLKGGRVENISRDSIHLLVARRELTIQGGEPADLFNMDEYQAAVLGPDSATRVLTADGKDLLRVQSPTVLHLELAGQKAGVCPPETPLFIGDFPTLTGETSETVTIVVGYEGVGSRNWRAQMIFDGVSRRLPDPPGKLGWFFVRCYDSRNILLQGWDFRWVRDVRHLSWDAARSELVLSHNSDLTVENLSPGVHCDREADATRCKLPLGPKYDRTWVRIANYEDARDYIEVALRVPRIQWALGPEDDPRQDLQWTQEPLVLQSSEIKATSRQALHIAVSIQEPVRSPELILWVGHDRLAPVRLKDGLATIPLRNLTSYVATTMDRPLTLQFALAVNHQLDEPITLGQLKSMLKCGRCSQAFDSMPGLRQHFTDAHPIALKRATEYATYYALASRAGLADDLPEKVYVCKSCGHTENAANPHVINPTSEMSRHFVREHPGARLSLTVVKDTSEIERLFDRVLEPLGECSECQAVLRANKHAQWNKHRDMHHAQWTIKS